MSCTKRTSRTIMVVAVVAALIAATAPAVAAAPRSAAVADEASGWVALLGPWQAFERWLGNLSAADSDEGGGGSGGENSTDPPQEPPAPTCPSEQNPGPCNDPGG